MHKILLLDLKNQNSIKSYEELYLIDLQKYLKFLIQKVLSYTKHIFDPRIALL